MAARPLLRRQIGKHILMATKMILVATREAVICSSASGINGFGRIGRRVLKALRDFHGDTVRVVAINGRGDPATSAHLLKYDSNYGPFPGQVEAEGDAIRIDGDRITVLSESDPREIAWGNTVWIS